MSEPIIEQIAQWIENALDGAADPDTTLILRSIRPTILDWSELQLIHGDVIIGLISVKTESYTNTSRTELAEFLLDGCVSQLPDSVKADTVLARFAETIRKTLLAGNTSGTACNGLAISLDCDETEFAVSEGGVDVLVKCKVIYTTNIFDGYTQS